MDKGRNAGHKEGPSFKNDIEVMPDNHHQHGLFWRPRVPNTGGFGRSCRSSDLFLLLALSFSFCLFLTATATAQTKADPHGYDIAVVIDNRVNADAPAAKEDVKAITDMLDRHLFADHIIQLENPTFATICDLFGGCPNEADQPWPSLISQVAHRGQSRLFVYYLGPARLEGLERQLLFEQGSHPYTVGWLHKQIEKTGAKSGLVLMETSFAPRPLPCASENPALIDQTMTTVTRNYKKLFEGRSLPSNLAELSATVPAQAPHCDRYDLIEDKTERPLFTKFILKGVVEGKADEEPFGDADGVIELGELTDYLQNRVGRAVQFQWGRKQTVWLAGSRSRAIARVEPRAGTFKEKKPEKPRVTLQRPSSPARPKVGVKPDDGAAKGPATTTHLCDVDQTAEGCLEFCAENPGDFRCPFIGVTLCVDKPISDACPCALNDPRPDCAANEQSWCRRSGSVVAPGANGLIEAVGGRPDDVCLWATQNESDLEAGILWQVFAPIGWRLIRPFVRPAIGCLLDCGRRNGEISASVDGVEAEALGAIQISQQRGERADPLNVTPASIDPPPKTAFEREICDETLPPHIGLPRWMPGTLMISEALRLFSDCRPTRLTGFAMPPPVTLVSAPAVPMPTYIPPDAFAMPPPTVLPPVQQPATSQPSFDPSVSQIRWLQGALMIGNHNPGPIDGDMGKGTRAAIQSWRDNNGFGSPEGDLTEIEFQLIMKEFGDLFDQVQPGAPLY